MFSTTVQAVIKNVCKRLTIIALCATILAGGVGAGLTRWLMSDMTIDAEILISEYTKVISAMFS